jgi:hypothetical protein
LQFLCSFFIKIYPANAAGFNLSIYQHSCASQVKSQKQTGHSGIAEKYRPKHLRFPTDLVMLKASMLSNLSAM